MLQPLLASDERKVVVSLSLDPKLIDKISQTAHEARKTRSQFVAEVLSDFLK